MYYAVNRIFNNNFNNYMLVSRHTRAWHLNLAKQLYDDRFWYDFLRAHF